MDAGGVSCVTSYLQCGGTTWDAHGMDGMVGNLTDVSTGCVYGCSPLTFGAQIPRDSRGWIKTWSRASRPS